MIFCSHVELDLVVAAGIRQDRGASLNSKGERCTEKKCTKSWLHIDSPASLDSRSNVSVLPFLWRLCKRASLARRILSGVKEAAEKLCTGDALYQGTTLAVPKRQQEGVGL
jgi:hypothetical protein